MDGLIRFLFVGAVPCLAQPAANSWWGFRLVSP